MALVGIQTGLLLDFTLKLRGCIDHKRELTAVENDRLVFHIDSGQCRWQNVADIFNRQIFSEKGSGVMGRGIEADCKRLTEGQNIHFNQSFFLSFPL